MQMNRGPARKQRFDNGYFDLLNTCTNALLCGYCFGLGSALANVGAW